MDWQHAEIQGIVDYRWGGRLLMALLRLPATLKRGVGRKILGLFLLAAILPVAFTAALAYFEVNRGMHEEIGRTLRTSATEYGFDLLGRLERTSNAADDVERIFALKGPSGLTDHEYLLSEFDGVWFMDTSGNTTTIVGEIDLSPNPDILATSHAADKRNRIRLRPT